MAKIVKKKVPAKAAAKPAKKAATKPVVKASAKPVKPAAKPAAKAPVKVAAKKAAPKAKETPKKKAAPAPKVAAKKPLAPQKPVAKAAPKKPETKVVAKKAAPVVADKKADKKAPVVEKPAPALKKEGKGPAPKIDKKPKVKKEENDLEDDFISDDDFGNDEIGEYEEELKVVEEADEEVEVVDEWIAEERQKGDEEVILTDAEGRRYCRSRDCDQIAIVDVYCRYHYLMFWKKIQVRKKILIDGKLERYVEELTARYPDKFLEMIRRDLRTEKDFLGAIAELEIDESAGENEFEEDNSAFIEEVRGMGESSGSVEEDDY